MAIILTQHVQTMFPDKMITAEIKSYGEGAEFQIDAPTTPEKEQGDRTA